MKKLLAAFIQKPIVVTITSIVIAGAVAVGGTVYINNSRSNVTGDTSTTLQDTFVTSATSTTEHLTLGFLSGGRITAVDVKEGDTVTKGEVLASVDTSNTLGALTEAQAAYASANANYQKVINGATESTVNVAQSSVYTAEQNLTNLVQSSYTQSNNAISTDIDNLYLNPTSFSPQFELSFYDSTSNTRVTLTTQDVGESLDLANERVDIGKLFVTWAANNASSTTSGDINAQATVALQNLTKIKSYLADVTTGLNNVVFDPKYQSNINTYKTNVAAARSTVDTLISGIQSAQATLAAAQVSSAAVTTSARPEDVAAAKAQVDNAEGAVEIAQSAYDNQIITAPIDGTITAVHITLGEIATPDASAIEMVSKSQ